MAMFMSRSIVSLVIVFLLAACNGAVDISEQIERQASSESIRLDLASVGPQGWERMCVLGPYASNETAKETLGFYWDSEGLTALSSSDLINALVFVRGNEVLAYGEVFRAKADFLSLQPSCISRSNPILVRKSSGSEWSSFVEP
jgi:hypothetical protein